MPQATINVHSFLQEFNPSKFIVYSSLLVFTVLLGLKLDHRIALSYWLVFLPLWIWKGIAILGALVGVLVWLRHPGVSQASYIHFKSMLISVALQLLLLMFEVLVCDKLESKRNTWTLSFAPLIVLSLLSISICVWSIKYGRGIELEFFAAVNILQFVLIALKLDDLLSWSWVVIFVPSWILLCFAIVIILYAMIFAAILLRSPEAGSEQRRNSIHSASASSMIFLPLLMFMMLLTSKLDSPPHAPAPSYTFTFLPLYFTLMILIRMSFGSKSGSLWWFGMRADFCTFLLAICPCLREYGNTSFVMSHQFGGSVVDSSLGEDQDARGEGGPSEGGGASSAGQSTNLAMPPMSGESSSAPMSHRGAADNEGRREKASKRLLHSLSRVLFRGKTRASQENDNENEDQYDDGSSETKQMPFGPKLNIDTPD